MSHFSTLVVVEPDFLAETEAEIVDFWTPILEGSQDVPRDERFPFLSRRDMIRDRDNLRHIQERYGEDIVQEALSEIAFYESVYRLVAPYQQNNMGDCPEQFLEFEDIAEDIQGDVDEVIDSEYFPEEAQGQTYGDWYLSEFQKLDPEEQEQMLGGRPLTKFDAVAMLYHEVSYNAEEEGYGYYHNPNDKWDYYTIGGRYRGLLKVKDGAAVRRESSSSQFDPREYEENAVDICRIRDLDTDRYEEETREKIEAFWENYQSYIETGEEPGEHPLYGVHYELMQMGLERTNQDAIREATNHNRKIQGARKNLRFLNMTQAEADDQLVPWQTRERDNLLKKAGKAEDRDAFIAEIEEVASQDLMEVPESEYNRTLTKEDLETEFRWRFEFSTYAAVDRDGWHSPGDMGWWGMSSDDASDRENWSKGFFEKFVKSRDPDTLLAIIDCHI